MATQLRIKWPRSCELNGHGIRRMFREELEASGAAFTSVQIPSALERRFQRCNSEQQVVGVCRVRAVIEWKN